MESIKEQARQRGFFQIRGYSRPDRPSHRDASRAQDQLGKETTGYVLVKCDLTDEVYHLIKNTPKVTGFLAPDKKPMPISDLVAPD